MAEQAIFGLINTPQNIKLELSNGTLTLKAGSVITIADGTQKVCQADITFTSSTNGESLVYANTNGTWMQSRLVSKSVSGDIRPLTDTYMMWFDTANQAVYTYGNDSSSGLLVSLPFAKITVTNGAISSIDQVFNEAGYIGSSIFIFKDISGFYPNGMSGLDRKFKTITTNNILVYNNNGPYTDGIMAFEADDFRRYGYGFFVVDTLPDISELTDWARYYSKSDNKVYYSAGGVLYVEESVPFCYFSTDDTAPYNIKSFNILNPFLSLDFYKISDYSKYLSNLLIIQYNGKPKAKQTIQSVGQMFPTDLILDIVNGFDLETATGEQLDILAKYIGVSRGYTDSNNQAAMLNDEEFSLLMRLKIIINTGSASLYGLETSLYNFFGNGIQVVDDVDTYGAHTMSLTYFIRDDWANVGLAAIQQDCLPHPSGVGVSYSTFTTSPYFGFVTYDNQTHPISTGFRDYDDPTKDGQMYTYDKQI